MAQEIELKLLLPPGAVEQPESIPLPADADASGWKESVLDNCYYDTPDLLLKRHKIALRIRHTGEGHVQTLKTKGQAVAGLHSRGEWEWPLTHNELDFDCLTPDIWPQDLDKAALAPAFETNFRRAVCQLHWRGTQIEMAFDRGEVRARKRSLPIYELELELKQGEPAVLFELALTLAEAMPVHVSNVSKGERGYSLLKTESSLMFKVPEPRPDETPLGYAFRAWSKASAVFLSHPSESTMVLLHALLERLLQRMDEPELIAATEQLNSLITEGLSNLKQGGDLHHSHQRYWHDPLPGQLALRMGLLLWLRQSPQPLH